ncbi:2-oxoglutarate dehydrogenase complex dihydrolipoyllysine-residue succinyltransferase [bacterium]|jgi:2-oxoglutarate dehydrogenase E2 component (dihydrolipoamide succinyltransferase)|nr:2-oxoglutarate dehydrogenase complex dihydrolipoyllysine-residue succinyltransferase [bacterium]
MKHNVVAPSVGESVSEVSILRWAKQSGEAVKVGDLLLEIESDKATVEIVAEKAGVLTILKKEGERVPIGEVIGNIDDAGKPTVTGKATATVAPAAAAKAPAPAPMASATPSAPRMAPTAVASHGGSGTPAGFSTGMPLSPSVRKMMIERGIDPSTVIGTGRGGRVTKGDVSNPQSAAPSKPTMPQAPAYVDRPGDRREKMTLLRARIAERLVQAQHTAAILTTFNEVDMTAVMALRAKHKDSFKAKHGVSLGFMSFFTRACVEALKLMPDVNATIDGGDIVYHDFQDIGIAVGTDRGLVVPVLRGAGKMNFVEIEKQIVGYAEKAKAGKLSLAEMSGGTFTISNGGVYGSLLSTPILNMPQTGILGMHKIQERPVAINGKVEIRPMMYLALSYDHRMIDGKTAVGFLIAVKDFLENPDKLGFSN